MQDLFKKFIISAIVSLTVSRAFAECYVYVPSCTDKNYSGFFIDHNDLIVQSDPNRCLARAREWLNYCSTVAAPPVGAPMPPADAPKVKLPDFAATYVVNGGQWRVAVIATSKSSQLYSIDSKGQFTPIASSY